MGRKGQNWSLEVIVALSLFLIVFSGLFLLFGSGTDSGIAQLQSRAERFLSSIITSQSDETGLGRRNVVDSDRLLELSTKDFDVLQEELGIYEDFCIIIETADGRIKTIGGKRGIGSERIEIDGFPCGAKEP